MAENLQVRDPVIQYAKSKGVLSRQLVMLNRRGYPDTTFMKNGIVVIMEFKDVDGELAELQKREIKKLREMGGMTVHIVDTVEQGIAILDRAFGFSDDLSI